MRMKRKTTRLLLVLLTAMVFSLGMFPAQGEGADGNPTGLRKDLLVLFTSDIHCGADQGFTFVGLKAARDTAKAAGNHVLLVDNGDATQGEAIGLLTQGLTMIELMNDLEYDIAVPGNHDFDYGMERFTELTEIAKFPYISCNFFLRGELVFPPYLIREFDGVKIAFVGVCTPETRTSSTPRFFQDETGEFIYDFAQDEDGTTFYACVQKAVDDARAEGAEYVIVLAHLGNSASVKPYTYADLIEHTSGIDAVLDGHSHDTEHVEMKNREGKTVIRQACGTKMAGIGWLRISSADGKIEAGLYHWNESETVPEVLGIQNEMTPILEEKTQEVRSLLGTVVATSAFPLTINDPEATTGDGMPIRIIRRAETNLGDLCADAIRAETGAEVGLISGGSIRTGLEPGKITVKDLLAVFPFGNKIVLAEVTGQQLLDALEWSVKDVPEENGGFLHASGMTYEIHTYLPSSCTSDANGMSTGVAGEYRVRNVFVGGEKLDPEKRYTVATVNYILLENGNGQTAFDGAKVLRQMTEDDYLLLEHYLEDSLGGVVGEEYASPYGQGRIIAVEAAP